MSKGKDVHDARAQHVLSFGKELVRRCKSQCELCGENTSLAVFEVPPALPEPDLEKCVMLCEKCSTQLDAMDKLDVRHWHCLNDSMWSEEPAVQVLAWRLLNALEEPWANELLEQMYLDEDVQEWAEMDSGNKKSNTRDSNGDLLFDGDTVHIIKDLEVKGAGFVAKRGTAVKNISLCTNPEHIEGRVNKTKIVLKTCFLKKST